MKNKTSDLKEELDDGTIGYYCVKCNKWEKYCKCNKSNIALLKSRVENLIRKTQEADKKEIESLKEDINIEKIKVKEWFRQKCELEDKLLLAKKKDSEVCSQNVNLIKQISKLQSKIKELGENIAILNDGELANKLQKGLEQIRKGEVLVFDENKNLIPIMDRLKQLETQLSQSKSEIVEQSSNTYSTKGFVSKRKVEEMIDKARTCPNCEANGKPKCIQVLSFKQQLKRL